MEVILESLMKVDNSVADLFLNEGIDDVETFLDLDEQDFTRLRLKTKLIKTIQKIQKDYMNNPIIEELEEGDPLSISDNGNGEGNGGPSENPYRGILLEQAIDINIIFSKTPSGNEIMEVLNEEINPNDKLLNQINRLLCEFLKLNYGLHPSTFHKNLLAVSLVNTYPVLGSTNRDVPQALWFYPHGRGKYRHAGRIHYHMEYMSRKSDKRMVNRPRSIEQLAQLPVEVTDSDDNIEELILELKFISPNSNTKSRAEELWMITFSDREKYRKNKDFQEYLKLYQVASAFDGIMISMDFVKMYPDAHNFCEQFLNLQEKVLAKYGDLFLHIQSDFLRTLAIIRAKNPSRGVKRSKNDSWTKKTPLDGIVEILKMDDPVGYNNMPPEGINAGTFVWKECTIKIAANILDCFRILCEAINVFNCDISPENKQFYAFIFAVVMNITPLTTTGEKFYRSIK
ncbi:uncharacterized protein LOC134216658 [Armigeres subalbatus]|uniref:uncharacterized protein LOC134216658 n=1 Tax=Armigeres subalbatus TaxID=124917 RepID=UPI002ED2ED23